MSRHYSAALPIAWVVLRILIVLNLVMGAAIVLAFVASFLFAPVFQQFFGGRPATISPGHLLPVLRLWMVFAVPMIAAVHVSLKLLVAMVETVRAGDPFVPQNAARLRTIAWCWLGIELLRLLFGVFAAAMNAAGSNIDWSWSAGGWVAVVLMFVLASVFEEGTQMRAELEGTI